MIRWVVEPVQQRLRRFSYDMRHGTRGTLYLFFIPIFSWTRWK